MEVITDPEDELEMDLEMEAEFLLSITDDDAIYYNLPDNLETLEIEEDELLVLPTPGNPPTLQPISIPYPNVSWESVTQEEKSVPLPFLEIVKDPTPPKSLIPEFRYFQAPRKVIMSPKKSNPPSLMSIKIVPIPLMEIKFSPEEIARMMKILEHNYRYSSPLPLVTKKRRNPFPPPGPSKKMYRGDHDNVPPEMWDGQDSEILESSGTGAGDRP
jgi:hypothetical protein